MYSWSFLPEEVFAHYSKVSSEDFTPSLPPDIPAYLLLTRTCSQSRGCCARVLWQYYCHYITGYCMVSLLFGVCWSMYRTTSMHHSQRLVLAAFAWLFVSRWCFRNVRYSSGGRTSAVHHSLQWPWNFTSPPPPPPARLNLPLHMSGLVLKKVFFWIKGNHNQFHCLSHHFFSLRSLFSPFSLLSLIPPFSLVLHMLELTTSMAAPFLCDQSFEKLELNN